MRDFSVRLHQLSQFAKFSLSLVIPALALAQFPSAPSPNTTSFPQPDIKLADIRIVAPDTTRITTTDMQSARLEPETVTVRPGDYVVALLAENGIRQNAQSLALIYDLNPQIEDIREIKSGDKLILPSIEGSASLAKALRQGYRVELVRVLLTTQEFKTRVDDFQQLRTSFTGLRIDRFATPRDKIEVIETLTEMDKAIDAIGDPNNIVNQKVMKQATAEVKFIRKTMSDLLASGRRISAMDLAQIKESSENLQALSNEVASGGSGLVRTNINTPSASTGDPVKQLRVFYAPEADRAQQQECSELSTPLTEPIARGDYVFWAMRGNEKVSEDKQRKIRKATRDIPLDIPITK
jgi:hypothetical protein